jgi:hypothetical protein
MQLSDAAALNASASMRPTRQTLLAGIPQTVAVTPEQAETFWAERAGSSSRRPVSAAAPPIAATS